MKIACLGWGSLIWDPRSLPIESQWFKDGPLVPVEFTRQSSDGRMTLVIEPTATSVQVLWAVMLPSEIQKAREALRNREGIPGNNWISRIGSWQRGEVMPQLMPELSDWTNAHDLDAAVWTALGPRFNGQVVTPTVDQVIEYLKSLTGEVRDKAEQYVRRTPSQIDTNYRRRIEVTLGWSYADSNSGHI